jgi:hypothetical protein
MKKWSYELPYISEKQKEILRLIHKFRFLNRIQIQTLMKHKDYKRINVWLKDLVEKDYLYRIYERKIPFSLQPGVYFLASTGVRFVRWNIDYDTAHKFYREKERSDEFRNKCSLLANLYIDTLRKTEDLNALNFFKTRQELNEDDVLIEPYPDCLISLKTSPAIIDDYINKKIKLTTAINKLKKQVKEREDYLYFLELIGKKTPRYYLRYRVQQYIEYSDYKGPTAAHTIILFVLPDKQMEKFLLKFIKQRLEETLFEHHLKFTATTIDLLQNKGMIAGIWTGIS